MEIKINKETDNLMKDNAAFLLLLKIAYNTKRDDFFSIPDLEIGEALINAETLGMGYPAYRTAKKNLEKWGFATFKSTNQGTIAKMTTDKFFTF